MTGETGRRLVVMTPSDLEIVMTRDFDAPRELVFEAHSKVEHVRHWWVGKNYTMVVCEMDFQPGGAWRFVLRDADGQEYGFRGEYREIERPARIVWTFEFEALPGHISVETLTFTERDGTTTLTSASVFDSIEDRDGMIQSGMEEGANDTLDALEAYLGRMS